jgi:filamentous hemagglutinin family protein
MKRTILALTPLALACKCVLAQTLPTGGHIVQGQGSIGGDGYTMVVRQSSQRMIADWSSFSIGKDNTVQFVQPSTDSVALNRVIGGDPSRILGSLSANGRVYIQNPNGVMFAKGAQVNVGSLVATTLQADAKEFMVDGRLKLSGAEGAGTVSNEGTINAAPGGHVVLAGPKVNNAGSITASGGTIAMAAAGEVTVDPSGSGLVTINVSAEAVGAQLVNSGVLAADGGRISLQAAAADAAANRVMQVDGIVRARSIENHGGEIVLSGGTGGVVSVGGQLDVSGTDANGGSVKVLGDRVLLQSTAQIDATGSSGGRVLVGGSFQGKGGEPNSHVTAVEAGARIDASAIEHGKGGDVVVWADDVTSYAGSIAARGGLAGGDGGKVEVSGRNHLQFAGQVDTLAPKGKRGTLLLDPANLDIGDGANVDGGPEDGDDLVGTVLKYDDYGFSDDSITAANVAALLATTDVTLQAYNRITVSAPISVIEGGADSTLTLNAALVFVNAAMTLNNTALNIDTQRIGSDTIRINAPVTSLRSVALTSTDIGLAADVTVPSLTMTVPDAANNGWITQTAGSIAADTVWVHALEGNVDLTQPSNTMGMLDVIAYDAAVDVDFTPDGSPLRTGATIETTYSLNVAGKVVQSRSMSIGGEFDVTTGADAALDDANNEFDGPVRFDINGNLRLHDRDDLDAGGKALDNIDITAGGLFTLGADISSTDAGHASLVQVSSAGFDNSADAHLSVQPDSRFIIRSSDFTRDVIGAIGFSANDIANVNYTVLNGWIGADPTVGNGYYTNRRGTIDAPNADRPPISRIYDRTTGFDFTQTGERANGLLEDDSGATGLGHYRVLTNGAFADPNAGTNKQYTVAATNNVVAIVAGNGSTVYGLLYESFTRPAGTVGPEGPGNLISEITPRPVYSNGVDAIDRRYDGTDTVALDIDRTTLTGVLDGDNVKLAAGNLVGTMADPNDGVDKAVTENGALLLGGSQAGNYVLVDQSKPTATITSPKETITSPKEGDPQEAFRSSMDGRHAVPPALVDLTVNPLTLPEAHVAAAPTCDPTVEKVAETRTYFFYFPYRSSTIDEVRSATEQSSLLQALGEGFEVKRVRGFTSPEGPRSAEHGFEGNYDLSYRRASATLAHLREVCTVRGESCVSDSVEPEAGSELHALTDTDPHGRSHEVDGTRLATHAVAEFNSGSGDARQRTAEIEHELEQARTPVEKAQVVYPQLRRVEVEVTRQSEVERPQVASTGACPMNRSVASNAEPTR